MKFHPPKRGREKPCERCLAPRRVVGKLCGFCYASDVRRFEEKSRKSRLTVKDAWGAVRNGNTKGVLKRAVPLETVTIREHNGRRVRFIKVRMGGPASGRWIQYARWWWEKNKGPVPTGKLVTHKDGDSLNDDSRNFMVVTPGDKINLAHERDPQWSKEQHRRAAAACGERNRKVGRINRARNFLKTYWYPVIDSLGVILNVPFRKQKRLLACFGADVSKYPGNGKGKKSTSQVQRALKASSVRPVKSVDLSLRRYSTYCLADPVSKICQGPMSMGVEQLVASLERMGIWASAQKQAKRDLKERDSYA